MTSSLLGGAGAKPLERTAELQQLSAVLAAAVSGRGQVCVIEGPSGIGKSRLLDECARSAQTLGMSVLRARCSELTRDYPYGVARNLFETMLVRADARTRADLMRGPAALAEPVFGNGEAADELGVLHGLYWLTVNLAEQGPTAILVDDLPWADDFSLRFLAHIAERLDDLGVALVVTIRCGDPSLTGNVVRETGGNPFLVVAVADSIRAGESPGSATPESIRRHIARRMARLNPNARDLAKAASVLGDEAALSDGILLAGLDAYRGRVVAEELILGQLLQSVDPILFAHSIVRIAVYGLLEPGERLALHAGAAKLLAGNGAEPEIAAEHVLLTGPTHEAWALAILQDAGHAALRKGAPAAALRYLRHAVQATDTGDPVPRMLIDLGLAEAAAGDPMSLTRFEQALDLISEPSERADALYSLGQTLYRFGRFAEAGAAFHRGAHLFEGGGEQVRLRFEGMAWSAEVHLTPPQRGPKGAVNGDGPGSPALLAVEALRQSLTTPPVSRAADLALHALGDGALLAEQGSQGPSVNLAILALLHCGRLIEAHVAADATVRDARDRGDHLAYAEASLVRAFVLYARGRINDAAADAQAAVNGFQRRGHAHAQTALAILAHCMVERGEPTEAASAIERAGEELVLAPAINAYVCLARGRMNLWRRDVDAARKDLDAAENALRDLGPVNPTMLAWQSLAGMVAHLSGDEARSRSLLEEEIRLARSFDVPIALGLDLRRRAHTQAGDQALESFRDAINTLEATEAKLELAAAHAGLGRGLRRAGQRIEARGHLEIALDLAHRCGATGLEAETREELMAAGGRPRRPMVSGVEALTPTELRVAHLAAEGLSNREIAEQTFVSRHTVAWHLRNIYRKLQVESREQLTPHIDTSRHHPASLIAHR